VQKQHLWEMYNSDDKLKTLTEMYTAKNNHGRHILKKNSTYGRCTLPNRGLIKLRLQPTAFFEPYIKSVDIRSPRPAAFGIRTLNN